MSLPFTVGLVKISKVQFRLSCPVSNEKSREECYYPKQSTTKLIGIAMSDR
jgi:hypothetical protein